MPKPNRHLRPVPAAPEPSGWTVTDHVCSRCLGRVLQRGATYRCADCGHTGHGSHESVCTCGVLIAGRDGGFRCKVNPHRSLDCPSEIIAAVLSAARESEPCHTG